MTKQYIKDGKVFNAVVWSGHNMDEVSEFWPRIQFQERFFPDPPLNPNQPNVLYDMFVPGKKGLEFAPLGSRVTEYHGKYTVIPPKVWDSAHYREYDGNDVLKSCTDEIEKLKNERAYAMAEIQNMKKRFDRERSIYIHEANKELLSDFVGIYDDIERALGMMTNENEKTGLVLVKENMEKIFENESCLKIECNPGDEFNPELHNALMVEESDEFESGKILRTVGNGWTLCGKTMKPVNVIVAK